MEEINTNSWHREGCPNRNGHLIACSCLRPDQIHSLEGMMIKDGKIIPIPNEPEKKTKQKKTK